MNDKYKLKWVSSLEKVFPGKEPNENLEGKVLSFLTNEMFSFQCAFYGDGDEKRVMRVKSEGSLASFARIREVDLIPSRYPALKNIDSNYLSFEPGLYPDLLKDLKNERMRVYPKQWQSLFITIDFAGVEESQIPLQEQNLILNFYNAEPDDDEEVNVICSKEIKLFVQPQKLPEQKLFHTEWFHADCLANYYKVEVWSKEYWRILKNFLTHYAKMGMNTILVPTFTPPLDTAVGWERTTVQLVDVTCKGDSYEFNFDRLKVFIDLAEECGIKYFEIAHLFTQWGAKAAPKVMAKKDGQLIKIFGWDNPSNGEEYMGFLKEYLTSLVAQLKSWGMKDNVFFHLSDEPDENNRETYAYLRGKIAPYLEHYPIMDALSRYSFYEQGVVDRPVPGIDHLKDFLDNKVENLWTYYCCCQEEEVSNRFFAMPSARNRILGILLYYHNIVGFLHWGFNFYNTQYSLEPLNPYLVTDAGGAFPSGDPFLVYPGEDGQPEDSLRMMVLSEAMQDIRALESLEQRIGRNEVCSLIESFAGGKLTMFQYPVHNDFILNLRQEVNRQIASLCK